MAALPRTSPQSLHERILRDIEGRILSGEWQPGHKIPFEHELTEHYGCSRMTVNKALTQLARAGLIARRRKAGSIVVRPHSHAAVLEIQEIGAEVSDLGLAYRFEIARRKTRRPTAKDHARLNGATPATILDVTCRHFAGEQPFCLEERIISLDAVPDAGDERFDEVPPGSWLVRQVPWTRAEHVIKASGADRHIADALDLAEGTPCLVVERRTWDTARAITHVTLTYPGDSHALVARFAPTRA
ncbi:MAG: histidine utilization repressor [Pararhizobium sp.]